MTGQQVELLAAPAGVSVSVAERWAEVVAAHPDPASIVGTSLEAYCSALVALRDAMGRIEAEGAVVEGASGTPVPHPAVGIAQKAGELCQRWAGRFDPPKPPVRRVDGYMVRATKNAFAAADHLTDDKYGAARAASLTAALALDMAMRAGSAEFARASCVALPTYLKSLAALGLTFSADTDGKETAVKPQSKLAVLRMLDGQRAG